ncbi:hypothetical protein GCM10027451_49250 [Geodermatophilus aquaeductus]|uniref:Uncharacterized protein n=1 Tax=Geodermatophilus aquaeductus TaxID=1564161 RepID=A0A521FTT1_9ACTN|nr:hypothetical protein [Geodermatophilus aquaeductus]SMO99514.1 hypothetical protein SAMN06273567_11721 [Geodermatophilus aquaeductus]
MVTGAGDDHVDLCGDCLASVTSIASPQRDSCTHDPRPDAGKCAEAALWKAVGGTDRQARSSMALAAVVELNRRIDDACADVAAEL